MRIESTRNRSGSDTDFNTLSRNLCQSKEAVPVEGRAAKRQDAARVRPLTACCTSPMRIRRPKGAAGTASDGPRQVAHKGRLRIKAVAKFCEWPTSRSVSDSSRYIRSRAQYAARRLVIVKVDLPKGTDGLTGHFHVSPSHDGAALTARDAMGLVGGCFSHRGDVRLSLYRALAKLLRDL